MTNSTVHQKGFTLIEMSIVLVIIGLIVGGVLRGQELIESSRQKNILSQVDRIRVGVSTFTDRFNALPGDYGDASTNINSSMINGNRSGTVSTSGVLLAATTNLAGFDAMAAAALEEKHFFNHLLGAGLMSGGSVTGSTAVTACGTGGPFPTTAYPNSCVTFAYGTHSGDATIGVANPVSGHWLMLYNGVGAPSAAANTAAGLMSPQNAFFWDSKYDDGTPDDGNIRTLQTTGDCIGGYTTTITANICDFVVPAF